MNPTTLTVQEIYEEIQQLPPERLSELAIFVDFRRFKSQPAGEPTQTLRPVRLRGLLRGYDFSPEAVADARRELWRKFQPPQS